jgi:hypothetical protein
MAGWIVDTLSTFDSTTASLITRYFVVALVLAYVFWKAGRHGMKAIYAIYHLGVRCYQYAKWTRLHPSIEVLTHGFISEDEGEGYISHKLVVKVKITNRYEGDCVVFLENLQATIVQKHHAKRHTLTALDGSQALTLELEGKGSSCIKEVHLAEQYRRKEVWINRPLRVGAFYVVTLSDVGADVSAMFQQQAIGKKVRLSIKRWCGIWNPKT